MSNHQPRSMKISGMSNAYVKDGVLVKYRDSSRLPSSVNMALHTKFKNKETLTIQEIVMLKAQGMLAVEEGKNDIELYNWNPYKVSLLGITPSIPAFKVINK